MVTYLAASNGRDASEFKTVKDDDPEAIDPAELAAIDTPEDFARLTRNSD